MGKETGISWCDATFNPWRGCTKVSAGCTNCYAETLSRRNPTVLGVWGDKGTRVVASEAKWREPLAWDREAKAAGVRRRVFCASLADVFEDRPELVVPRIRLFHLTNETPHLDWLILTKRPENVRRFCGGIGVPRSWAESTPPNVWLGVSAEDQARADERIPVLLDTPARVRFVSYEPALGPLDLTRIVYRGERWNALDQTEAVPSLDWLIAGAESGSGRRPFDLAWLRSAADQCAAAGVPLFVKQDSAFKPGQQGRIPDALWSRKEFPTPARQAVAR